jgi:transcriptional regulator with XRE-family HTH domain
MMNLKQLRKGRGMSQDSLARFLQEKRGGKAWQGPISVIESGKVSPTVKRLADIVEALGYSLEIRAKSRGNQAVILDVKSLLGNGPGDIPAGELSRVKDTRVKDAVDKDTGPPSIPAEPIPEAAPDQDQNSLQNLLQTILTK